MKKEGRKEEKSGDDVVDLDYKIKCSKKGANTFTYMQHKERFDQRSI